LRSSVFARLVPRQRGIGATPRFAEPNMGVRPDAPTNETIGLTTFCEIIKISLSKK
jgi:hypothetical protein